MKIIEDKSYINNSGLELIKRGFAELNLKIIKIEKYYTEEEKENNFRLAHTCYEEWVRSGEKSNRDVSEIITLVMERLNERLTIYQYDEEKNVSYSDNWDLFFWCNYNSEKQVRNMTHITLTLNKNIHLIQEKKFQKQLFTLSKRW